MKIFGIAGFKNAGKTKLVVELVQEFRRRGLRVGTVKHAHHDFDIDHPGKDSYQHRAAGAEEVIVASGKRWAHVRELGESDEPPLADLLAHFGDLDLVLIEGYKQGQHPKLVLHRAGADPMPVAAASDSIKLLVTDDTAVTAAVAVLPRNDVPAIADFVWQSAQAA